MGKPEFSVIIPTIVDSPPTLASLPDEQALMAMGGELIVVRDRWGNASRTRNIGAAVARGTFYALLTMMRSLASATCITTLKDVLM